MKNKQITNGIVCFAAIAMLFTSCASDHTGNFTARKYTHFRKGEATVFANPRSEKNNSVTTEKVISKINFSHNTSSTNTEIAKKNTKISAPIIEQKNPTEITKSSSKRISFLAKREPVNAIIPSTLKTETTPALFKNSIHTKANMREYDQIVQIICAIFIPPLGVYLHENAVNTKFWIDLLLCFLFFFPGMIYALLVVTDSI